MQIFYVKEGKKGHILYKNNKIGYDINRDIC